MSRYLYEHLYLGHLYFETMRSAAVSHRPVRPRRAASRSRPIATRRPYDDPGVERVYLPARARTRSASRQDAHALRAQRGTHGEVPRAGSSIRRTRSAALPSYDADTSSNPFAAFRDAAGRGRYRFMLDEAEFT